jgi:hypothetical protein
MNRREGPSETKKRLDTGGKRRKGKKSGNLNGKESLTNNKIAIARFYIAF